MQNIELKIQEINDKIENKLYILGSISSFAPFIGLLGTVWGIMNSFLIKKIVICKKCKHNSCCFALLVTVLGPVVAISTLIFNIDFINKKITTLSGSDLVIIEDQILGNWIKTPALIILQ